MKPLPEKDPGRPDHRSLARYLLWLLCAQWRGCSAGAALARLLGVGDVPPDRAPGGAEPDGRRRTARDVTYAHRLHTAHDADRVAVVEDGRITELGTHDELLTADGSYAARWKSWRC